jgi:hypothetical protein
VSDQTIPTDSGTVAHPTPMSPAELSILIWQHSPKEIGPCPVCGHEMTLASMGGGEATRYVCGSTEASPIGKHGRDERDAADSHYRRSAKLVTYHGDPHVVRGLRELRAARGRLGENMTVPVGAVFFPEGHGQYRCSRYVRHLGDDQWERVTDIDYAHDPAHATLKVED